MSSTIDVVPDQTILDDMRRVVEWAILRTSGDFAAEVGGIEPESIVAMRKRTDLYGHLAEVGWPQLEQMYGPRDEDDLALLRALAEEEIERRRMETEDITGSGTRDPAILLWAWARMEVAERVIAWLDREEVTS